MVKKEKNRKKILYGIQGTGNGHLSRAREIIPILKKYVDVDVLVSGTENQLPLDYKVDYFKRGLGFYFDGGNGKIDVLKTLSKARPFTFIKDVYELPAKKYDFIINDIEPISAWAAYFKKVPSLLLSHQASLYSNKIPKPKGFHYGEIVIKAYMPPMQKLGLHFQEYDDFITTPVIRKDIREGEITNKNFYLIYLNSLKTKFFIDLAEKYPKEEFVLFTKERVNNLPKNLTVYKNDIKTFTQKFLSCKGIITSAGFETPAEALFLGKKLMVVPLQGQFEQFCNAKALEEMGVSVAWKTTEFQEIFKAFKNSDPLNRMRFPDKTDDLIFEILKINHLI